MTFYIYLNYIGLQYGLVKTYKTFTCVTFVGICICRCLSSNISSKPTCKKWAFHPLLRTHISTTLNFTQRWVHLFFYFSFISTYFSSQVFSWSFAMFMRRAAVSSFSSRWSLLCSLCIRANMSWRCLSCSNLFIVPCREASSAAFSSSKWWSSSAKIFCGYNRLLLYNALTCRIIRLFEMKKMSTYYNFF